MRKSYLITSVLLSFVSCDLSVLDKTKDVLSEVRAILETDAVKDVASGKAGFTIVSETKTGSVGVSKTQGEVGFDRSTVDSSGTRVAGSAGYANPAGVGSVVEEDEAGNVTGIGFVEYDTYSGRYAPEFGVSGSNPIERPQILHYGSTTSGGTTEVIEDSYSSGMSGFISGGASAVTIDEDTDEDYKNHLIDLAEKEASKKYDKHIKKAKDYVQGIYTYTSRLKDGYKTVDLCLTKKYDSRDLENSRSNYAIATKKLAEYTKEQLEKDLQGLLDQIVGGIASIEKASENDYSQNDLRAKNELSNLKKSLEDLIKDVKSVTETNHEAYRKVSRKSHIIAKISSSVSRIQNMLNYGYSIAR
ncbi:hypothetical protein DB313_05015 (plasmid) [Borrelia turcica IST7]|uniref:Uncharacterized protein n=1 Tax=Borrelia turcica IST7 TaxID=1104446 RepID=A0A386PQ72_9SPIR|nr:hypothetical protein [Borrelia turcica]AYE36860.1 hypothetical protein DB313_05015 [Borrelia turcica IST7]